MTITYDTSALGNAAGSMDRQSATLEHAAMQQWQAIVLDAASIPAYPTTHELHQVLADAIPAITQLLALRALYGKRLANSSGNMFTIDLTGSHIS